MSAPLLTHRGVVYPHQCDHMGHLNVMWYVAKFDEATWQLFSELGLSATVLHEAHRGMAAVEQHIWYKRELRAGATLSVRSQLLEVKEKSLRFRHEMRNDNTGEVAAIMEMTVLHFDTAVRKACPFPPEFRNRMAGLLEDAGPR